MRDRAITRGESRDLLIASAGGHLAELLMLAPRLRCRNAVWVTYDRADAAGRFGDSPVVAAHHPTTKNIPNAVRNYWLAREVFAERDIDRVISTGAAVAVPFLVRARQLGIPCHYIESATRVEGPSLSGRMLQRLSGVHLYRQLGGWGEPRWQHGPSVFDGYTTRSGPPRPVTRVMVSLGTHRFAFDSLVERLVGELRGSVADISWQLGSTGAPDDLPGIAHAMLPPDRLRRMVADADIVIGHAGVGLTLTALSTGKVPLLVPRRQSRHEHTDDHQVQLARELDRRGLAIVAEVGELTGEHLQAAAARAVTYREPPPFELLD
jgi:UDP-N-acetylglucosamine--N-acetylmuramyl-(pentapeptide) pyrophosphoryl-undecaprenol N-acetylglucosamine transferase